MLRHGPEQRPSAEDLVVSLGERHCCMTGSVALQALAKERLDSNIYILGGRGLKVYVSKRVKVE
jgi:hypothetical protein